jgi:DNA-binding transcriptional LysR family regulator
MDRLANMEAFARVAESGSFSEAARRLGTSKSLVSRQVAALETELGARLLHRTTRSLTLTEEGRGYHAEVVRILAEIQDANLSVSRMQAAPRGRLKVNAPMSFSFLHLAPMIPDFLRRYPEVDVDMTLNDRYVDLIEEGFDVAVRIGRLADSSLVARKLAPMRPVICASPGYLRERGVPETPDDLRKHLCLCNSTNALVDEWRLVDRDGRPVMVQIKGRLRANNGDTLRIAALQGLGLVNLPTFFVGGDLQAGTLVSVLSGYMPQDAGIYAVYPHSRHLLPKVRAFVDFLAERIGPRPYWDLVE